MWMRSRPQGLKFRRQHPVGPYVLDFYCASARLAVEVDGGFHDVADQIAHDQRRDDWLRSQGIRVLRIKAVDVLRNLESVTRQILNHCCAISPPSALRAATSPSDDGED
ncbi:MAG TPA: endonuclease domain-containing protein [Sphingobium sp.]